MRRRHIERGVDALARPGRPRDGERAFAPAEILRIDQDERECREMIAMQVVSTIASIVFRIDITPRARNVRRGTGNRSGNSSHRRQMKAGVETPAGAERIARADNRQPHVTPSRWCARRLICQRRKVDEFLRHDQLRGRMKSTRDER
jgi:hypothetical protein